MLLKFSTLTLIHILTAVYSDLRRFASLGPAHPRVSDLLRRRDSLKAQLETLERSCQRDDYTKWREDLCSLPVAQHLKVLNRSMRRRSAAGACLSNTPLALDSYKDHFERQFRNEFGIAPQFEVTPPLDHATEISIAMGTFPTSVVHAMVMRSPAGKAPGASGMPAELLHPISEFIVPTLAAMFAVYMALAVVPSSWKRALICPVPKKGDLSRISNYRPISLTEVTRKIFEMCLLHRFQRRAEITLSREQGGFREGRSTIDQVQCLDKVIKFIRSHGKKVCMVFLDIKAAYDSVPRGELWRQCLEQGLEHVSISCLRSLFDHNSAQLVVNQHRSSPFTLPAGVLQGSVLSPLLYSIYLDPLVEKLSHGPRISLPHQSDGVNALLYADDIALIASSPHQLRRLLQIAEEDSLSRGYRFSPSKCIVVGSDRQGYRLYDAPLIRQSSFRYLGIDIDHRGVNCKLHAAARSAQALKAAERLRQVGARFRNFPPSINIQLYAAFIRPGLEYGLVLLHHHQAAMWNLQQCQKRIVCSLLGVHPNARNDVIEGISNCPKLSTRCIMLRTRRAEKLQALWSQDGSNCHALVYVSRGLSGADLSLDPDLLPLIPPVLVRHNLHFQSVTASLAERYGGFVDIGTLRWLLLLRLPDGIFRTLLLWLLQRWRIFGPPRLCLYCRSLFTCQYHVVSCTGLRYKLLEDCPANSLALESATFAADSVVENVVALTMAQTLHTPDLARSMLTHIEASIRASLEMVFGPPKDTL